VIKNKNKTLEKHIIKSIITIRKTKESIIRKCTRKCTFCSTSYLYMNRINTTRIKLMEKNLNAYTIRTSYC